MYKIEVGDVVTGTGNYGVVTRLVTSNYDGRTIAHVLELSGTVTTILVNHLRPIGKRMDLSYVFKTLKFLVDISKEEFE